MFGSGNGVGRGWTWKKAWSVELIFVFNFKHVAKMGNEGTKLHQNVTQLFCVRAVYNIEQ